MVDIGSVWLLLFVGGGIFLAYQRIDLRTSTVAAGLAVLFLATLRSAIFDPHLGVPTTDFEPKGSTSASTSQIPTRPRSPSNTSSESRRGLSVL